MDLLANLALGFDTALTLSNLLYCFIGVLIGTLIGVLPGIGPVATIAMLLPVTFTLAPVSAMIMLAGIYYGAQYGGSTSAILINLPGEITSVATTLDGHAMAKQGRAGVALATAAIGSFVAGTISTFLLAAFAPPLAELALKFGPHEYFALMVLGLVASIILARGSLLRAGGMILLGLLLGLIGADVNSGAQRFTFGVPELADGIGFVVAAMGMFGLGEIARNLENEATRTRLVGHITTLMPTREDFRRMVAPILRGTFIGSALGILPGNGAVLGSFTSYSIEKKLSKTPEQFGKGAIEGVAGVGQQCRCPDLVHSNVDARHSLHPGDGAHDRRAHHPRHPAGAHGRHQSAGAVLGHHRFHVDRQRVPADSEPAADRHVGALDHGALSSALSGHSGVLCDRCVQPQRLHAGRASHGAVWSAWLCVLKARV
jgi:putative tricarboxylic transport membrane protein